MRVATSKKTARKSPAKKAATGKVAKKSAAKTGTGKAPVKSPAKKSVAKKAPARATAKKTTTKKTTAKKTTTNKTTAKKATTKKATTKKVPAAQTAKKTTAGKASGSKTATGDSTGRKRTKKAAGKTPAKKATAKQNVPTSKTATGDGSTPVIPPEYDYLHDKAWLTSQREALLRERASYTSSADRLAAEAAALMADREPGDVQFDEESGEGDTIAVERDRDLALSAAARQSVADIDAALARLDSNTYGICLAGDDIIPRERLEAIPEASVCVMHKTLMF